MSKKKVSGNTMTLKDFHGGSIPSDLPLPSAPGVSVRPLDRFGHERPSTWGNSVGRSDHRSRPHTSPATRHFDDKAPFLAHSAHIGRNFDEDERKPLDGLSAPRRTISDESIQVPPVRVEVKLETSPKGGLWGRQGSAASSLLPSSMGNSFSGQVNELTRAWVNSQDLYGSVGQGVGGTYPNAWAAGKQAAGASERVQSVWSAPAAVSKLAHASALEKVSSGRWQSKYSIQYQADVEAIWFCEAENGLDSKVSGKITHNRIGAIGVREHEHCDVPLENHAERILNIDESLQAGTREVVDYERVRIPENLEVREIIPTNYVDRGQPDHVGSKFVGCESQALVHLEASERPKLKLLPRTKPVESLEFPAVDHAQGYQLATQSGHTENVNEVHVNTNPSKPGLACTESGNQAQERPKLNLKPRSQPLEQVEGNSERGRNSLFGDARPRELVLKERGVSDTGVVTDYEKVEYHVRSERVSGHSNAARHSDRNENHPLDHGIRKRSDRSDHWVDTERRREHSVDKEKRREHSVDKERVDMLRRNWHNENRKNRENERQQQQPDRPPSPETWRKPMEQPKHSSADAAGLRYGKVASAIDLVQTFSRSVSDPNSNRHSSKRGLPGPTQVPFSRLMGATPRPPINGY